MALVADLLSRAEERLVTAPKPPLLAIVGPTASGKSGLALRLARALRGEIVSCDSLQVYRGLDIGSAKPSPEERAAVVHHLVDVVDPRDDFSAADYARLARRAVADVSARGLLPIVAGGSGLYLRALLGGLFEGPSRDAPLRARLTALASRFGDARLHRWLRRVDPDAAGAIQVRDRVRVVRALEVYHLTGRPISALQRSSTDALHGFEIHLLGLDPPRDRLRRAVEERTRRMLEQGLVAEVKRLLDAGVPEQARPLQAIGYAQARGVLRGEIGLEQAQRDIVTATMRYAKRQLTWFRHQADARWLGDVEAAERSALEWTARRSGV